MKIMVMIYRKQKNVFHQKNEPVDYFGIGHAVFSSPQVAGVGKTEEQLKEEGAH